MVARHNGPPLPGTKRRAGKILWFGNLNDPDCTSTDSSLQSTSRREAGLEPFAVILDNLAIEYGWPFCTATAWGPP